METITSGSPHSLNINTADSQLQLHFLFSYIVLEQFFIVKREKALKGILETVITGDASTEENTRCDKRMKFI